MYWGWPLKPDSCVSFTYSRTALIVQCASWGMRPEQKKKKINTPWPGTHSLLLICLFLSSSLFSICFFPNQPSSSHVCSHLPRLLTLHPFPPPLHFSLLSTVPVFEGIRGTYLAEEMTSLCLSESRILARWEATESAYWVMWTWDTKRERLLEVGSSDYLAEVS